MKPNFSKEKNLSHEFLRSILSYNKETGIFIWIALPHPNASNIKIGDIAGSIDNTGYRRIWIRGERFLANRLAWFYVHGVWPSAQIDHANRNRSDDRFSNLREATHIQNKINSKVPKNSLTGVKGVHLHVGGKYQARININGKKKHLGLFDTIEAARLARLKAEVEAYGEFAESPS